MFCIMTPWDFRCIERWTTLYNLVGIEVYMQKKLTCSLEYYKQEYAKTKLLYICFRNYRE